MVFEPDFWVNADGTVIAISARAMETLLEEKEND